MYQRQNMKTIGIIGAGNLGKHLYKMFECNRLEYLVNIGNNKNNIPVIDTSDIIFLTVKPNDIKKVCEEIKQNNKWNDQKTIISTAAGVSSSKINEWLGNNQIYSVIRCMPNIPISSNSGSIIWYHPNVEDSVERTIKFIRTRDMLESVFKGPEMIWLYGNEELLDVATVMFGCSPAYIANFFDIYLRIGQELGFTHKQTHKLLLNSFSGTINLLKNYKGSEIINEVASKGGATEKALEILKDNDFDKIIELSIQESLARVRKISKTLD